VEKTSEVMTFAASAHGPNKKLAKLDAGMSRQICFRVTSNGLMGRAGKQAECGGNEKPTAGVRWAFQIGQNQLSEAVAYLIAPVNCFRARARTAV
jgi:hypothetical protein